MRDEPPRFPAAPKSVHAVYVCTEPGTNTASLHNSSWLIRPLPMNLALNPSYVPQHTVAQAVIAQRFSRSRPLIHSRRRSHTAALRARAPSALSAKRSRPGSVSRRSYARWSPAARRGTARRINPQAQPAAAACCHAHPRVHTASEACAWLETRRRAAAPLVLHRISIRTAARSFGARGCSADAHWHFDRLHAHQPQRKCALALQPSSRTPTAVFKPRTGAARAARPCGGRR